MNHSNERMKEIIYPALSYKLMSILFRVHRKLGNTYQEKYYQRAIEVELKNESISYKRECLVKIDYDTKSIGRYYLDFLIDDKIALEIKTIPFLKQQFIKQVLAYLDANNLKLGIIANFSTQRLVYKRLVNPRVIIIKEKVTE